MFADVDAIVVSIAALAQWQPEGCELPLCQYAASDYHIYIRGRTLSRMTFSSSSLMKLGI